jgi:hypothetical protein
VGIGPITIIATTITTANNKRHSINQLTSKYLSQLFPALQDGTQALVEAVNRSLTRRDVYGKNSARLTRIHLARDQT